jgi:hypothetical protein
MAAVSWFGFAPQNLVMPVVLAAPFAVRRLWVEALLVLGSQSASLVTVVVLPHVDLEEFAEGMNAIQQQLHTAGYTSVPLTEGEALVIDGQEQRVI